MKQKIKFIMIIVVALFLAIQLIPVDRENLQLDADLEIRTPADIKEILKNSCYDCHSNQTNWPFYSYIAPISWLVAHDVNEGRSKLNFSEWNELSAEKRSKFLEEIVEEISEDEMPLSIYVLMHPGSRPDDKQKSILSAWVEADSVLTN